MSRNDDGLGGHRRLNYASGISFVLILTLIYLENFAAWPGGLVAIVVFAPQHGFAVLPLLLALVALRARRFPLFALNALALGAWAFGLLGWNVPFSALNPLRPANTSWRIMTYNVQRGERGLPELMAVVARENPAILCLQETQDPPPGRSFPGSAIRTGLRGWNSARGGDVMTLSRFPLLSERTYPLSGARRVLETVWQTPQGAVRVLNVHITKSDAEKQLQERQWSVFSSQLATNARRAAQTRLAQLPALETAIERDQNTPLIMAGDFNSPPRGPFYRALTASLDDAWTQGGWGNAATFPSRWPLVGIDHIFLRGARATRAYSPVSRASDHLPLIADVVLETR